MSLADRAFRLAGALAVLDTVFVTYRYLALHAGAVTPRTGLCSFTTTPFLVFEQGIDCDPVLLSAPARAFYVPNATLGLGFFVGCLVFYVWTQRLGERARYVGLALLAAWLSLASLFTIRFFWLLAHLPTLCVICPWNHVLTWAMTLSVIAMFRRAKRPAGALSLRDVAKPSVACVGIFVVAQALWAVPYAMGELTP